MKVEGGCGQRKRFTLAGKSKKPVQHLRSKSSKNELKDGRTKLVYSSVLDFWMTGKERKELLRGSQIHELSIPIYEASQGYVSSTTLLIISDNKAVVDGFHRGPKPGQGNMDDLWVVVVVECCCIIIINYC